MNIAERKNLTYRIIAALILLITLGMITFSFIVILQIEKDQLFLDILTLSLTAFFLLAEEVLILRGGKKEFIRLFLTRMDVLIRFHLLLSLLAFSLD